MTVGSLARSLAAVAFVLAILDPSIAWAKKPKPLACPGGVFTFAPADAAAIEQAIGRPASAVVLKSTSLALAGCSGAARMKASRKGTAFKARLASCGGLTKLKIKGTLATPGCGELHATLAARHTKKLPLAATRGLPPTTRELIGRALADGRIDYPTSLAYRTWAFFLDPQLPPEFDAPGLGVEDTSLFAEIRAAWSGLPAGIQADLAPYVARPDDPASAFGPAPPAQLERGVARDVPQRQCPHYWTHVDADEADVRVWDCSSGDATADAAFLGRIAGLFDKHWLVMTGDMGPPIPDDGAGGSPAIDVYLVEAGTCMRRGGLCRDLEPPIPREGEEPEPAASALAVPAEPFIEAGGAETASGFIILKRERAVEADKDFERDVIHETFHVLQFAHATKTGKVIGGKWVESFFTEASATWSEWMYLPEQSWVTHGWWSEEFLLERGGLLMVEGKHEYSSYIWPFFIQQERRAPEAIFTAWVAAEGATGPDDLDAAVDQQLQFKTNFRRFAIRNLNWKPPGNPLETVYHDMDGNFPEGPHPAVEQLDGIIEPGIEHDPTPVEIQSLQARYDHFEVEDHVRHLVFDFEVDPQDALDVDALVKVDDTWKRIRSEGNRRLEFCREDPEERIDEIILVLSNHARNRDANGDPGKMTGNYFVTASESCADWTGSFRYVYTTDEVYTFTDQTGTFSKDNHSRVEGSGSIAGSTPAKPGDGLAVLDLTWTETYSLTKAESEHRGFCVGQETDYTATTYGSATGPKRLRVFASDEDPDQVYLTLTDSPPLDVTADSAWTHEYCDGRTVSDSSSGIIYTDGLGGLVNGIDMEFLAPDPGNPGHYAGRRTIEHVEEPRAGGSFVTDSFVEWDFQRRARPR